MEISLGRKIAKSGHLLPVISDNSVDLLRGQDVFPLARAAFAEKAIQVLRSFAEAIRFFLSSQSVIGPAGGSELVNYRVRGNYYIVDRLFAAAELRLGDKDSERRVRIVRTDGKPRS